MRCTLGGVHCDALGPVGWVFTAGTHPHLQMFEMDKGEAGKLIDQGGDVDLVIDDLNNFTVQGLSIVGEAPSSAPMYRTVIVADLRWRWSRVLVTGQYNMRRRTGQRTLISNHFVQLGQTVDNFEFAPASLKGETSKWTPQELMKDILNKLSEEHDFDFDVEGNTDDLDVNDLIIRDHGPEALDIALTHLPGQCLWVDRGGKVHVQSAIGLKEASVIEGMGPDIVGGGHATKVSYKNIRPRSVKVYFVREQAVRHDSSDEGRQTVVDNSDARLMRNVCLVTDPFLTVNGQLTMFGSWATIEGLMVYWNTDRPEVNGTTPVPPPISHTVIQQSFFEDALFRLYVPFGGEVPQPIWAGRINAIKGNYRQTFQVNRRWVDRSWQILAIRPDIIDPTTGVRGRSQAYGDYCVKVAAMPSSLKDNNGMLWANVYGGSFATGAKGGGRTRFSTATTIDNAQVTPAIVTMVDDQAGIVHLDYVVDPYGAWKQVYPCTVDNLPSGVMNDTKPKGVNMKIGEGGSFSQLSPNFNCAVILDHIPAMPNGNGQFYMIEVKPGDVSGLVKGLTIEPAGGPSWGEFIDPQVATARMGWLDSQSAVIERSFGVGANGNGVKVSDADNDVLKTLLVNEDDLISIAQSKAAEIWSKLTDRYIGAKTVRLDPSLKIQGSIESIEHRVDVSGAVVSRVTLPEELASRSFLAIIPPGVRKIVFREVVP